MTGMDRKQPMTIPWPLIGGLTGVLTYGALALCCSWFERLHLWAFSTLLFLSFALGTAATLLLCTASRNRIRFSLRAFFLIVTAIGALAGWAGFQFRWMQRRAAARNDPSICFQEDPSIYFQESDPRMHVYSALLRKSEYPTPAAPWSLRLLGERGVTEMWVWPPHTSDEVRVLFPEAIVHAPGDPAAPP